MPPVIDVHNPPKSIDALLAWTRSRQYTDEDFIRKWYDSMVNEYFWCYPKTGEPLNHWVAYFISCYRNHQSPTTNYQPTNYQPTNYQPTRRHADNWIGTKKENLVDVLA